MSKVINLSLAIDVSEIGRAAAAIEAFCEENALPPRLAFEINLAVDELVTNTVWHGFRDRAETGQIKLALELADDGWISLEIRDNGAPYDPFTQAPAPVLDASVEERPIGGLGVYFVRRLMDETSYSRLDGWNCLSLRRRAHI